MPRKVAIVIFVLFFSTGCELITIGTEKKEYFSINQLTSVGTVYLFKLELDNCNVPAASDMIVHPEGNFYLAIERYEMFEDMSRLKRIIAARPVTFVQADTLSERQHKIEIEIDYLRKISFYASKVEEEWFISNYNF